MMTGYCKVFGVPILMLSLLSLVGCAGTRRPVLYPDAHFHSVGEVRAREDVDHCMRLAKDFGAPVHDGAIRRRARRSGAWLQASGGWFGTTEMPTTGPLRVPRPAVPLAWSGAPYVPVSPRGPSGAS